MKKNNQAIDLWIVKNLYKGGGRVLYCNYSNYMSNIIITKVVKTGNSLTVVIPKNICIQRGDQVSFGVYSDDVICIRKITQRDLLNLKPKNINHAPTTESSNR